jgi:hypothetical protein
MMGLLLTGFLALIPFVTLFLFGAAFLWLVRGGPFRSEEEWEDDPMRERRRRAAVESPVCNAADCGHVNRPPARYCARCGRRLG